MTSVWNHNIHYHEFILSTVPEPCLQALDIGCGTGLLTRRLAAKCAHVTGIDLDRDVIAAAKDASVGVANVEYFAGDAMTYPLKLAQFDLIVSVATLHHLPLESALARFESLLAPHGTLTIVGLYRAEGVADSMWAVVGGACSWILRRVRHHMDTDAPMRAPHETLLEIRKAAEKQLPGCVVKRRLLHRYTLVWKKPSLLRTTPATID